MSSKKPEYVWPIQSLHEVWKQLGICEKEATIGCHHGSAVKLGYHFTCRRNLTQRLVDLAILVQPVEACFFNPLVFK